MWYVGQHRNTLILLLLAVASLQEQIAAELVAYGRGKVRAEPARQHNTHATDCSSCAQQFSLPRQLGSSCTPLPHLPHHMLCMHMCLLLHHQLQVEWRGEIVQLSWSPRAYHLKGLLSDEECEHIKKIVSPSTSLLRTQRGRERERGRRQLSGSSSPTTTGRCDTVGAPTATRSTAARCASVPMFLLFPSSCCCCCCCRHHTPPHPLSRRTSSQPVMWSTT
jgi:hypothetical protein